MLRSGISHQIHDVVEKGEPVIGDKCHRNDRSSEVQGWGISHLFSASLISLLNAIHCHAFATQQLVVTSPAVMGLYNGQELVDFKANSSEKSPA